jgi:hypothetical protein
MPCTCLTPTSGTPTCDKLSFFQLILLQIYTSAATFIYQRTWGNYSEPQFPRKLAFNPSACRGRNSNAPQGLAAPGHIHSLAVCQAVHEQSMWSTGNTVLGR